MKRTVLIGALMLCGTLGLATETCAQAFRPVEHLSRTEISGYLGLWGMFEQGLGEGGLRFTRNRNEWFGIEGLVAVKPGGNGHPRSQLAGVNVRVASPHPTRPGWMFVTAGFAAATNESMSLSPMIGAGALTGFKPALLRLEFQFFPMARLPEERFRLLLGLAVGF